MPVHLLANALAKTSPGLIIQVPSLQHLGELLVSALAFTILGLILFAIAFWIIRMVLPFSIRKEIEDDQNIALGIIIASIIIGIALIVAAAIHG